MGGHRFVGVVNAGGDYQLAAGKRIVLGCEFFFANGGLKLGKDCLRCGERLSNCLFAFSYFDCFQRASRLCKIQNVDVTSIAVCAATP